VGKLLREKVTFIAEIMVDLICWLRVAKEVDSNNGIGITQPVKIT